MVVEGGAKFQCTGSEGGGAKRSAQLSRGGQVLSASDFRNSNTPPAVIIDLSLSVRGHIPYFFYSQIFYIFWLGVIIIQAKSEG